MIYVTLVFILVIIVLGLILKLQQDRLKSVAYENERQAALLDHAIRSAEDIKAYYSKIQKLLQEGKANEKAINEAGNVDELRRAFDASNANLRNYKSRGGSS